MGWGFAMCRGPLAKGLLAGKCGFAALQAEGSLWARAPKPAKNGPPCGHKMPKYA